MVTWNQVKDIEDIRLRVLADGVHNQIKIRFTGRLVYLP